VPDKKIVSDTRQFFATMAAISGFETSPTLAIAVSGGADSMALLLLAQDWVKENGGSIVALTVDHGLRPGSAAEALQVQGWCKTLGIAHHILTWSPPALASAIPMQAREARYRLMSDWCCAHHILHLLTAHHQGDQAETLLLRTARGSFIDGLACMAPVKPLHGIRLLRPLLSTSRLQLESFLLERNQPWLEDPTNRNLDYTRNLLRHKLPTAKVEQASQLANEFAKYRNLLECKLANKLTNGTSIFPEAYVAIALSLFKTLPPECALRALSHLIVTLTGQDYPPRTEKLERLYEEIMSDAITKRRAFSGLIFAYQQKEGQLLVTREPNATEPPLAIKAQEKRLWDRRFWVTADKDCELRPLGADGLKLLGATRLDLPKAVLVTLPSFWRLEELLAVPHIQYGPKGKYRAAFRPAKPLAGAAFSVMTKGK